MKSLHTPESDAMNLNDNTLSLMTGFTCRDSAILPLILWCKTPLRKTLENIIVDLFKSNFQIMYDKHLY